MTCQGPWVPLDHQPHVLGHGLQPHAHSLPVLIEGVNLHDGSSHWIYGEILGEKEGSWSGGAAAAPHQGTGVV